MNTAPITLIRTGPHEEAGLIWQAPSGRRGTTSKYDRLAASLKKNPGEWAIALTVPAVDKGRAHHFASHINLGKYAALPKGEFKAVSETQGDETHVFVRYLGEVSA